jgi:hypothetical protein
VIFLISNNPVKPYPQAIPIWGRGREGVETPSCLRLHEFNFRIGTLSGADSPACVRIPVTQQATVTHVPDYLFVTGTLDHFFVIDVRIGFGAHFFF